MTVSIKFCPKCEQEKSVDEFNFNSARFDGYAYCCKVCRKYGESDYTKRTLELIYKDCISCKRNLPRPMFIYSQSSEDCLTDECRTCRLYKPRGKPTLADVEAYERELQELLARAKKTFDPANQRVLFEEFVYKQFNLRGLSNRWKAPLWLNTKLFKDS